MSCIILNEDLQKAWLSQNDRTKHEHSREYGNTQQKCDGKTFEKKEEKPSEERKTTMEKY